MTTITAADVNKLRAITGAGMMDCKKALMEADGDFDKAVDNLRKKGQKVAANRSDRSASEGVVLAKVTPDGKKGVLLALNCETDFVAKNDEFVQFANDIIDLAINNRANTKEEILSLPYTTAGMTIGDKIVEMMGKIGEKIEVSTFEVIKAEKVVAYNHPGNKLATIVGFNQGHTGIEQAAKEVAMQVAAMNPIAIDKDQVDAQTLERELEIAKEQARQEGKPEEMLDKIAMGKLNKFYKESTLLNQDFIRDSKKTVAQYLKETDSALTVTDFKRVSLN